MSKDRIEVEELVARRVVAQGLFLVDDSGLVRASCQLENAQAVQTIYDEQGRVRARLGLDPDGSPSLSLTDAGGQIRAQVYLKPTGEPRVGLADSKGRLRTKIYLDDGSEPSIGLAGENGKPIVLLGEQDGKVGLVVNGKDGKPRARLAIGPDGKGGVALTDANGQVLWQGGT